MRLLSHTRQVRTSLPETNVRRNFRERRHGEVRSRHHAPTSGSVKLHSWSTAFGQQSTEAEPGRLGVFILTHLSGSCLRSTPQVGVSRRSSWGCGLRPYSTLAIGQSLLEKD